MLIYAGLRACGAQTLQVHYWSGWSGTSKYIEVPRSTSKYPEVPQSISIEQIRAVAAVWNTQTYMLDGMGLLSLNSLPIRSPQIGANC